MNALISRYIRVAKNRGEAHPLTQALGKRMGNAAERVETLLSEMREANIQYTERLADKAEQYLEEWHRTKI